MSHGKRCTLEKAMAAKDSPEHYIIKGLILHDSVLGMGYDMLITHVVKSKTPTISYVSDKYNRDKVWYGNFIKGKYQYNEFANTLLDTLSNKEFLPAIVDYLASADSTDGIANTTEDCRFYCRLHFHAKDTVDCKCFCGLYRY